MATIAEQFVGIARGYGSTGTAETIAEAIDLCVVAMGGSVATPHGQIADAVGAMGDALGALPAYVVSFDANGGTGTQAPVACAKGAAVALPTTTTLTAPSGKQFAGWGATAGATEAVSTYAATAAATLYAIWEDEEE